MTANAPDAIRISVVVICHNQAAYIETAVQSVLDQTAQDAIAEIIVVDDGSSDGSVAVIKALAETDPRISLIARESGSGGAATPRNEGIAAASGTHIAFLDGDDIWLPEKIAHQLEALRRFPDIGLLFSDFIVFDNDTGAERLNVSHHYEATDTGTLRRFFIHGGPALPSCAIISRAAVETVGVFDAQIRFNEENDYWLRIATAFPLHHQPKSLIRKREWFGSLGSSKYGLENLECKREITRRILAQAPELADIAPRREAQIEFKMAVHFFKLKDKARARSHLRQALKLDPRQHKARLYMMLSYLAADPEGLINMVRAARTKAPSILR